MNPSMFSLEGRVALVIGGSRGIGRASALALADAGAAVVVSSRKIEGLETVAGETTRTGRQREWRLRPTLPKRKIPGP